MIKAADIFNISSKEAFNDLALQIFYFQFENNPIYRSFCDLLYKHPSAVKRIEDIPFLPIQFFKSHQIIVKHKKPQICFSSSGTTGQNVSKHYVADPAIYIESFTKAFKAFYGAIEDYTVLALLPNYLERSDASLIYMVNHFINSSKQPNSDFFLNNFSELKETLVRLDTAGQKVLLIGVSFALLDFVETYSFQLKNTVVMETGGMKGRRKEIVRTALHDVLKRGFGIKTIHSEYGMTELLSQAYSLGKGLFKCPPWMQVISRDPEDALTILNTNTTGGLNIIDLANVYSCAFIATQDLGKVYNDGSFEVLGRFDNSDLRGCNLMLS